jgi:hypothetical protein
METLWNVHVGTGMPPGLIHDQGDLLLEAGADGTCKLREYQIHHLDIDRWHDQPLSAPGLRMHEAVEIHPCIPLLDVDRGDEILCVPRLAAEAVSGQDDVRPWPTPRRWPGDALPGSAAHLGSVFF